MSNPTLKTAAFALAEATPKHLGKPTLPPQGWRQEDNEIVVLLADGRKVRGPLPQPVPAKADKPLPVIPASPKRKTDK